MFKFVRCYYIDHYSRNLTLSCSQVPCGGITGEAQQRAFTTLLVMDEARVDLPSYSPRSRKHAGSELDSAAAAGTARPKHVGILAMDMYFPKTYVEQVRLIQRVAIHYVACRPRSLDGAVLLKHCGTILRNVQNMLAESQPNVEASTVVGVASRRQSCGYWPLPPAGSLLNPDTQPLDTMSCAEYSVSQDRLLVCAPMSIELCLGCLCE